ncbi:MAG: hypothetical protein V8Q84_00795 [Bilophila sp.]
MQQPKSCSSTLPSCRWIPSAPDESRRSTQRPARRPTQDAPTEVREIWHFTRPANGTGTWKLDGIQQVDNSAFN